MPKEVDINEIRELIDRGAQLVDVLPAAEYEQEHIAGAINVPLKKMNEDSVAALDKDRPVVTYCHDYQ